MRLLCAATSIRRPETSGKGTRSPATTSPNGALDNVWQDKATNVANISSGSPKTCSRKWIGRDVYFYGSQMSGFDGHVLARAWWISVFPGLAIMMTTMSINFIGDGLRQVLDPRLKIQ